MQTQKLNAEQVEEIIEGLVKRKQLMTEFIEISERLGCWNLREKYNQRYFIIQAGILRLRNYQSNIKKPLL